MRVATTEMNVAGEEPPQTAWADSTRVRPLRALGLVLLGVAACAWVLQGQRGTGISVGDLEGAVELAGGAQKAGVLSVCSATMQVLSVGSGNPPQKYDISSGTGTRSFPCPFGSKNMEGEVAFECSESGLWMFGRHNCYQCEGKELTVNLGEDHERNNVNLDFGRQGQVHFEPCVFPDGHVKKTFPHGEIMFSCGASREWELSGMTCSDRKCADAEVVVETTDGKEHTLKLEVDKHNEDQAEVKCPGHNDKKMTFECAEKGDEMIRRSDSNKKEHFWQLKASDCFGLGFKYPGNDDWCAARTAKIHVEKAWDDELSKDMTIQLYAAFKGIHEYKCPSGWPNAGKDGKMQFECLRSTWALKYMDCTGDEIVGQKAI